MIKLNECPIEFCGYIEPIDINEIQVHNLKNASVRHALDKNPGPIAVIINQMVDVLCPKYKNVLVDVKWHYLSVGDIPCLPGWHLDGGPNIPSDYLLCVVGSSMTQFYTHELYIEPCDSMEVMYATINHAISENVTYEAEPWQMIRYNHLTPHRGAPAHVSGPRLLIRVMSSDHIKPVHNSNWTPITTKRKK